MPTIECIESICVHIRDFRGLRFYECAGCLVVAGPSGLHREVGPRTRYEPLGDTKLTPVPCITERGTLRNPCTGTRESVHGTICESERLCWPIQLIAFSIRLPIVFGGYKVSPYIAWRST